jgi:hypothetical protein
MGDGQPTAVMAPRQSRWLGCALPVLLIEKIIQHITVSIAFYFNWMDIGDRVAVAPRVLILLGAAVAVLFALALWGVVTKKAWAPGLVIGLALFDIIGEFVVQATLTIAITVSFVVSVLLLILGLIYRRQAAAPE